MPPVSCNTWRLTVLKTNILPYIFILYSHAIMIGMDLYAFGLFVDLIYDLTLMYFDLKKLKPWHRKHSAHRVQSVPTVRVDTLARPCNDRRWTLPTVP